MSSRNSVNLNVNPCKMCMPMGASLALQGIENCMTIIHGSQGCSTYIRRHMAGHYNEPIDIASSSLTEEGTVYGGAKNLKAGILNLIKLYNPKIIAVLTSCLAETIGDDITRIVKEIDMEYPDLSADLIAVPTPGYGGSQTEGFYRALRRLVAYYSESTQFVSYIKSKLLINIVVSNATCEDIRELKRMISFLPFEALYLPDISDALDAPYDSHYEKLNPHGTKISDLKRMKHACATIELGDLVDPSDSPGQFLYENYLVPVYRIPLPVGLENTDRFINLLCRLADIAVPEPIAKERGRLLDGMIDSHKHNQLGKAAIYGDMELVQSVTQLCMENGIKPLVVATGTPNPLFKTKIQHIVEEAKDNLIIYEDTDFETIRESILKQEVNLMIGNSDGRFIWEKDGIDLVRIGFPIHDHVGGQRMRIFGYKGALDLLDRITNTLLDQKHRHYRERMYQTYYKKSNPSSEITEEAL